MTRVFSACSSRGGVLRLTRFAAFVSRVRGDSRRDCIPIRVTLASQLCAIRALRADHAQYSSEISAARIQADFRRVLNLQFGCRCQKQPSTNTTRPCFGRQNLTLRTTSHLALPTTENSQTLRIFLAVPSDAPRASSHYQPPCSSTCRSIETTRL